MIQENQFAEEEGDCYFERNYGAGGGRENVLSEVEGIDAWRASRLNVVMERLPYIPKTLLEIGCCHGLNLEYYRRKMGSQCFGADISPRAIAEGRRRFPEVAFEKADAAALPYPDDFFDVVSFDICMLWFEPKNLFRVAAEANRILKVNGTLVIFDFEAPVMYRNTCKHGEGVYSYKIRFRDMFLWHPAYSVMEIRSSSHSGTKFHPEADERLSLSMLYKSDLNDPNAFLTDPFR